MKNMEQNDVQSFIEKVFSQVAPENFSTATSNTQSGVKTNGNTSFPLNAQVIDTHSYIFVRIPIDDEVLLKQMKLYHTSTQSIIEGIPESGDRNVIQLPGPVKKKGASAHYKDSTLEITLPKSFHSQYSEIDIPDID